MLQLTYVGTPDTHSGCVRSRRQCAWDAGTKILNNQPHLRGKGDSSIVFAVNKNCIQNELFKSRPLQTSQA